MNATTNTINTFDNTNIAHANMPSEMLNRFKKPVKKSKTKFKSDKKLSKKSSKSLSHTKKKTPVPTPGTGKIQWNDTTEGPRNIYLDLNHYIEPVKVIYKYKNANRKTQYLTYIFVGALGKKHQSILSRIENLNIYNSLLEITCEEELKLAKDFGDLWITKFFNIYHICAFVNQLETNETMKKNLLKKYDIVWINNFINKFQKDIIFRKVNYSYGDLVKLQYKVKMGKKLDKVLMEKEDYEELNFSEDYNFKSKQSRVADLDVETEHIEKVQDLEEGYYDKTYLEEKWNSVISNINRNQTMYGGNDDFDSNSLFGDADGDMDEDYEEDIDINFDTDTDITFNSDLSDGEEPVIAETVTADGNTVSLDSQEINLDEIEKLYQEDEVDKNIKVTNTMLSSILENNKIVEKKSTYMMKFDDYQDQDTDNDRLENVYIKKIVYNQYIFKDETIKNLRNKICAVIKGNERFSHNMYLIPSRIYLWSEYIYNGKPQKIMIGQKWMKKNELFNISIEPQPISDYDNITPKIKEMRDAMRRYAGKIRREDEDNNIICDYADYIMNDTIYMCDVYNELGQDYKCNPEQLRNISETYFKLYFPKIKTDDIQGIINYLNKSDIRTEETKMKNTFDALYNDLLIEKEVTDLVEHVKLNKKKEYVELFKDGNFITQSVIHVNLDIKDEQMEKDILENKLSKTKPEYNVQMLPKLDLFQIFDDFVPDDRYSFIQYQKSDGELVFKYNDEYMKEFSKSSENIEIISKWFENSPYGISFKIKISSKETNSSGVDKFMAINLNDIGKIAYKTGWKEEDNANIHDIINTYDYVKDLVRKINDILLNYPRKISIKVPENHEFIFAFINCIQKFHLPEHRMINHNDFSDFCVFFFPYISLQIEPRKRIGKTSIESKSKYGSYLRYKRVSKFDNVVKIEQRILSYMKNYEFEDDILGEEISKQFNITIEKAKEEIQNVRAKFPSMMKGKKHTLKKSTEPPKFKTPGIGIDIQGKMPDKYKIRISGAREQDQLERIIVFMNVLMFLYAETYIKRNPEYQEIKAKLKKLTNVAKRRGKVDEFVIHQKEMKVVKQMAQSDKKRLGFTPDEGQNQWTRSCQNSGNDKKRRPTQTLLGNIKQLIEKGYVLNKKTGDYEKKVNIKSKNGTQSFVLKALKVTDIDETTGLPNEIYYSCDPTTNGTHMFVGFLTRSNNPFGECMPCCFKKNKFETKKKETIEFYKRCMGERTEQNGTKDVVINENSGEILYILQDTNKIQEGRIGYLPKYLDMITNINLNKQKEIKNHYLMQTPSYFFKLGIKQEDYSFMNSLSTVLNIGNKEIKNIIIDFFNKDTEEMYYLSLNDGDIRAEFRLRDFITFIQESEYIDYYYLKDIIKIPGLFTKNGILPIIFNKSITFTKDDRKMKEDFYLLIDSSMGMDFSYYMKMFDTCDILIMIKDGKFYYPIVEIVKQTEASKNIEIKKFYDMSNNSDKPLIQFIKGFFEKTVQDTQINFSKTHLSARETYLILKDISSKKSHEQLEPISQVIDTRFKCKYLITKNYTMIPVIPSSINSELPIICLNTIEYASKIDCFSKLKFTPVEETRKNLDLIYKLSDKKLNIKPIGLYYDHINDKSKAHIVGIMTSNNDLVPVKNYYVSVEELKKNKIIFVNSPKYYELDAKLATYDKFHFDVIDDRIRNVNTAKFLEEAYQLFKFELSNVLSTNEYEVYRTKIKKLIKDKNITEIEILINKICTDKDQGMMKIIDDLPNVDYYRVENKRKLCSSLNEDKCNTNPHCTMVPATISKSEPKCKPSITSKILPEFIKKLSNEICEIDVKAFELLKERKYFISDIVDYNNFSEKQGEKIVKSSNTNLPKILSDIFGKEHVPKIGKRHSLKSYDIDVQGLQNENPIKDIKDAYTQNIILYNYSIIRTYVNGFYWIKHELYTLDARNLGYYSSGQNELVNLFRSLIIDWLNVPDNVKLLSEMDDKTKKILKNNVVNVDVKLTRGKEHTYSNEHKLIINKYIVKLMESTIEDNFGLFELVVLNNIHHIPIVMIVNGIPKYLISDNKIIVIEQTEQTKYLTHEHICIGIDMNIGEKYPNAIESVYYKK